MSYFNPKNVEGVCFTCLLRDNPELCKACMKLHADKTRPGRWIEVNNHNDPAFRKLYDEISEETDIALHIDGDGSP